MHWVLKLSYRIYKDLFFIVSIYRRSQLINIHWLDTLTFITFFREGGGGGCFSELDLFNMLSIKIYNNLTIKALVLVRYLVLFQFYLIGLIHVYCKQVKCIFKYSTFCFWLVSALIFLAEQKDKETQLYHQSSHAANENLEILPIKNN